MGGSATDDDWEITSPTINSERTLVMVGRTGNGKSATGNSILGRKVFDSMASSAGVTRTCEKQKAVLKDGQVINVIDTPGLFDFSCETGDVGKEIVKCIQLAKEGIHAVIVVLSVGTRFSQEELAAIRSLQTLFGRKIANYMVVVFTGGDGLEDDGKTLEDYLGRNCPYPLKEILVLCENRRVLFDNKTKDERKRIEQVQKLLSLVNIVVTQNGGKPYMGELFVEMKEGAKKLCILPDQQEQFDSLEGCSKNEMLTLKEQIEWIYKAQLKQITEMVEALKETTTRLEKQLVEEQAARLKAGEIAQQAQKKSDGKISKLREQLKSAQEMSTELLSQQAKKKSDDEISKLREQLKSAQEMSAELLSQQAQKNSDDEISKLREQLRSAQEMSAELDELRKRTKSSGSCSIL